MNLLKATEVTLTWPAGEDVQTIKVTPGASRALTTTEIAEGKVVLTGLTPETAYTVNLLRGTKTRGTITFTTIIDLGDAKPVYADATQEELTAIFDALEAGDKVPLGAALTLMVGNGENEPLESDSIENAEGADEPVSSESPSSQDDSWF